MTSSLLAVLALLIAKVMNLSAASTGDPTDPYKGHLSEPTRRFYQNVGLNCASDLQRLQQAVAESYHSRDYEPDEYEEGLLALKHGASPAQAKFGALEYRPEEPATDQNPNDEVLVLYVDPMCGECSRVVRLVLDARKEYSGFPPIAFRILPNTHGPSQEVATMLEYIRIERPELFTAAVLDALQTLPEGRGTLQGLAKDYLGKMPSRSTIAWHAAESHSADVVARVRDIPIGPPFGIYHGRLLAQMRPARIPFDVFRDSNMLVLALATIDASSGAKDGCKRLKKRSSDR